MAVTLKQEVNLSRRACRPTDCSREQRTLLADRLAGNGGGCRRHYGGASDCGERGANNNPVTMPAKELTDCCTGRSGSLLTCLLATLAMCAGQVLLKLRHSTGGWELHQPRLGSLCIYVVFCSALLSHNAFVLARPNLSAPASGEKVSVGQLSPLDLAFDASSGPLTSASQLKRSAEAAAIIASTVPSSDVGDDGGHGDETAVGHGKAAEGEGAHGGSHDRYPVSQVDFSRVETPFVIGVWILSASIAKIGFHMTPKLSRIFPESCLLIVVGVIIGVLLRYATNLHVSPLTPNTFFFYMLPPIILDAGYFMPNRMFFDNIGTILLMAVIGTIFNIATIGTSLWACGQTGIFGVDLPFLHIFLFASLIAAVDPVAVLAVFEEIHVNEVLYIVVFGESLLNDAVTVVMYHMFEVYNQIGASEIIAVDIISGIASFFVVALGGTIIGVIWGFLTGLVTRFTDHVRVIEPIFIFVMAYLAYLNAEIFHMSGILAITFCGITMKNYVEQNVSHKSHTTIKYALKMLSSSAETIIFMFLGVATVNNKHVWNTWFVLLTIIFCSVYRILGVLILSALANRFRIHKLTKVDQFVMSYGGLRGAVAFALVLLVEKDHIPLQPMFLTTTIAVVYFTVFLQGITIKPLVKILNVKRSSKRKPTMNERIHERFMDHMMAGIEDIVGKTGNYNIRDKFKRFDNRFIRPYLIKNLQGPEPKILETYSKLTMRDAMDYMRRNPSTIGQMSGTESMSALFRNYTSYFGGRCGATMLGTCPSFTNLENSTRNLDMQELDYNPSKKDLTDAKIHHLLSEELKPYRRASLHTARRLSYSRHAVDDRDLSTQVNYKMQMNIRRMISEKKHHKRSKRVKDGKQQNHVSFPEFVQNGSAKQFANDYINEVLHEDNEDEERQAGPAEDWDGGGLTFTAKSSPASPAISVKHTLTGGGDRGAMDERGAEKEDKRFSRESRFLESEQRVATPTAIESVLPWKRVDESDDNGAIKQNEFPSWASNKEYLAYNSPSATFLGGLTQPKQAKSVIGLFRRESSGSGGVVIGGVTDSETSTPVAATTPVGRVAVPKDKRSASIAGYITIGDGGEAAGNPMLDPLGISRAGPHANAFPVTASHRRNNRRGSMLELSGEAIPEENYTKSLPERDKYGARRAPGLIKASSTNTPKSAAGRRSGGPVNPQTTALLSASSTDSDDDEDEVDGHRSGDATRRLNGDGNNDNDEDDEDDDDEDEDCADEQHPI
ncbi:sodium/hydrogen exchanger 3 isoform X1 [Anopheles stephensi]|uniref:sodium/hydrogen exchanger 3 isoform X1 n=1 Tax=Anopheles stephensi TaxID=30069 RepID=UPI001658BB24|nr:sodium/hydrogen exchanger 3 isoform X1 [Anopheles stephensi]XP_035917356.1 sodium/hydrogen exchanger 3 isoform X1 [Anopheles stephensi]XP_035917357.1 sodium/hydrogen exchanger 3 isoform X1 [Anopheles stephensi]XP_035917358.1 sodium/hydrogen exchanger 3 isoform X1 [Anopheles stephensi]XP_035917359.1 sodium/hydrogen exchanger 3 isoform X1 [Anopheles stephensi]XP_035917360.1 sodium/hydrogen exchanger 3 isoform X1 [Anopheles stephensi]XP_035917361.1 sodium/hydrogen exchanger 3 isoform X1 [Anop